VVKSGDRSSDKLDLAKYEEKVKKLEDASDALEKFMGAQNDTSGFSAMHTYMEDNQKLVKAAKEQIRRIKEKKPFSSTESRWIATGSGWMVEGSASKMVKAFNEMIDQYNRLQKDSKFQKVFNQTKPGATAAGDDDE
jgi:predicted Zn-dependent protease